jgi:hypothetical protein
MSITICNIGRHDTIVYDNTPETYVIPCPLCEALDAIDDLKANEDEREARPSE